ncbi:hypothetical protein R3P38DRAFT_2814378 [Favolaschia claudopus]|uniref:Uncharacterized protein n=1 Tax=Favolaschia claudopus TaxID=2862362 RepID=A0AAV9Z3Q5_9AGAR
MFGCLRKRYLTRRSLDVTAAEQVSLEGGNAEKDGRQINAVEEGERLTRDIEVVEGGGYPLIPERGAGGRNNEVLRMGSEMGDEDLLRQLATPNGGLEGMDAMRQDLEADTLSSMRQCAHGPPINHRVLITLDVPALPLTAAAPPSAPVPLPSQSEFGAVSGRWSRSTSPTSSANNLYFKYRCTAQSSGQFRTQSGNIRCNCVDTELRNGMRADKVMFSRVSDRRAPSARRESASNAFKVGLKLVPNLHRGRRFDIRTNSPRRDLECSKSIEVETAQAAQSVEKASLLENNKTVYLAP